MAEMNVRQDTNRSLPLCDPEDLNPSQIDTRNHLEPLGTVENRRMLAGGRKLRIVASRRQCFLMGDPRGGQQAHASNKAAARPIQAPPAVAFLKLRWSNSGYPGSFRGPR